MRWCQQGWQRDVHCKDSVKSQQAMYLRTLYVTTACLRPVERLRRVLVLGGPSTSASIQGQHMAGTVWLLVDHQQCTDCPGATY
jgi:hypothetical protein